MPHATAAVSLLRQAWEANELHRLESSTEVDDVLAQLMSKPWVVYSRDTGEHAETVVDYLSRYTRRIAISEQRLVAINGSQVAFHWKDYAANGARKLMRLDGVEFIRRFLMHVLPTGFMRIRHYGFLANCHRCIKLTLIQTMLSVASKDEATTIVDQFTGKAQTVQIMQRLSGCPLCRCGCLRVIAEIKPLHKRR